MGTCIRLDCLWFFAGRTCRLISLPVLIVMIIAGILVIVLAVHYTGGSKSGVLNRDEDVLARFEQDYPQKPVGKIYYTQGRHSAFFALPELQNEPAATLEEQATGLVHAMGAKFLTRILTPHDIQTIVKQGETGLRLHMHDFSWPEADFIFTDKESRDQVYDRLTDAAGGNRLAS